MSKPANKTLIGLFVVGAVILAVLAVVLLGSGKFFTKRQKFVMYFSGSVNGLSVGSPLQFRGIKIGEVTKIAATFNSNLDVFIPVYVDYYPGALHASEEVKRIAENQDYPVFHTLLSKGLKAQLMSKSLITGQLYIGLDFHPDKPIQLVGIDKSCREIPTIPSTSQLLIATLEKIPLTDIASKILRVAEGLEQIVTSPETTGSLKHLNQSLYDIDTLVKDINLEVKPLVSSVKGTSDAARKAFSQAEKTLAFNDGAPARVLQDLHETLEGVRRAVASYEKIAERNANIGYELSKTLGEIEGAARSIRLLSDYLEQHPEAIVNGKPTVTGD